MTDGPTTDPTVYVLIPVHNRLGYTRACLTCLERQTYTWMEVVVIDDGSTDGTSTALAREFPRVTVLRGNGRLWWTGAMAMGVRHVLRRCAANDYILCQNNDTLFELDYVSTLVRVSRERGGALVGSVLRNWDDGTLISLGPKIDWWRSQICDLNKLVDDPEVLCREEVIESIDALPGRGTLVPVRVFRRIGNFRPILLPHYIADYEFSARAKQRGERLLLSTRAVVYTVPERPRPAGPPGVRSTLRAFFSRRSNTNLIDQLIFFAISGPPRTRPRAVFWTLRHAFRALRGALNASRPGPARDAGREGLPDHGAGRASPPRPER